MGMTKVHEELIKAGKIDAYEVYNYMESYPPATELTVLNCLYGHKKPLKYSFQ